MKLLVNKYPGIVLLLFFLLSFGAKSQVVSDSNRVLLDTARITKAVYIAEGKALKLQDSLALLPFKPNPVKVVWMATILPGAGQIMNHKYWKLPIVYGSFLGCAYAITWNGSKYQDYRTAYRDIIDNDPTTNTFLEIIPKGLTINSPQINGISGWTRTLKAKQDAFRRYRDLSIIVTIGVYALSIVDAYVDAQLYDFDISPELSFRFQPTLLESSRGSGRALGMLCTFNLK